MANKATMGPIDGAQKRTYRFQGVNSAANPTRGIAVVQGTADDQFDWPTAAGNKSVGILEEDVNPLGSAANAIGRPGSIIRRGECIAIAGGAVNAGDWVKVGGANGQLITTTTTGDQVVGRAMSSAANAGDEFVIDVGPFVY